MARISLLVVLLLGPLCSMAQFTYVLNDSIPVTDLDGTTLAMPWAGGLNGVQYNTMDLNEDGKPDLVVFDRTSDKVFTFLNKENKYQYASEYEVLFPKDLSSWILLRDYNGDGKKDIFTNNIDGIKVYTNTTVAGENLSWKAYTFYYSQAHPSQVIVTKGLSGIVNLQLQYDDLPSISDMDGDGDLDILNVDYNSLSSFEFHENFSERFSNADSMIFELQTQNWGGVTECTCGKFAFNNAPCSSLPSGRVEHAGGKSLLALDVDGDDDLDLLFSEAACNNLYLFKNEGTTADPVFSSGNAFPGNNPASFWIYPAPYYEDLDFDGVRDIAISPNIYKKVYLESELDASNWFYKNTSSSSPGFQLKTKSFLQEQMIDLGDNSTPAFADADGDGDFDLFVSQSFTQNSQTSKIYFYENIGTTTKPEFKLKDTDYLDFTTRRLYNTRIQFADMNGDSKIDLAFTASAWADSRPVLYYFLNSSTSGLNFSGSLIATKIKIAYDENVYVTDIGGNDSDKPDGKPDLLIGRDGGGLEYWINDGSMNFTLENDSFLGLGSTVTRQDPVCTVGDLDGDGKKDIILSGRSGVLSIVSDYRSFISTPPKTSDIVLNILLSPLQDSIYTSRNLGGSVWPTIVNLFETNKPAIVAGNTLGGLYILENDGGTHQTGVTGISIYPNPVFSSIEDITVNVNKTCALQIFTSLGQTLNDSIVLTADESTKINVNNLSSGVYFFRFTFSDKAVTKRIVVY